MKHLSTKSITCILLFFISNACCFTAFAYEVATTASGAEIKWDIDEITFYLNTSDGPSESLDAILTSMQTWNDVSTASFRFTDGGITSSTDFGTNDGFNLIDFGSIDDIGVLAENRYWAVLSTGEMVDSDIRFNTDFEWSTDGSSNRFDVQNVATHELGHSLNLDDLYDASDFKKTMYGNSFAGETKKRTLHRDDKEGITYLYPSPDNSHLMGTVFDSQGNSIKGVKIKLKKDKKTKQKTKSDKDGTFEFPYVVAGSYTIKARKDGYEKFNSEISLEKAEEREIEIEMEEK